MNNARAHILAIVIAVLTMLGTTLTANCAPKGWEPVKSEYATAKTIIKETEFEIKVTSGAIIVNANRPIQIKIFTILGREVSSETLPAGTHRFTLPAHGVYIVKIGDITCKVAV